MLKVVTINTASKKQLVDLTKDINDFVAKSKIDEGQAIVFAQHTTCAIVISEIEDDLKKDIISFLEKEGPKGPFIHSHGDFQAHDPKKAQRSHTSAHILSAIIGQSRFIPISKNRLNLGPWQRVCLLELDGPRTRQIALKIDR